MTNIQRKLSAEEIGMWLGAHTTAINFTLTARLQGNFTLAKLRAALAKARQKHPLLSVRITKDNEENLVFTPQDVPDFSIRVLERQHADDWQREVEAELRQRFDLVNGPLVRFVWLNGDTVQELIFVCHHGVADGLAAAYLIHDVLTYLGDPEAPVHPHALPPGLQDLVPDFAGRAAVERKARFTSLFYKLLLPLQRLKKEKPIEQTNSPYQLLAWELSLQQTSTLVARCRTEETSVHAALCTAFLRAFGELHQDGWRRTIQSPINLRSKLSQSVGQAFGFYIGVAEFPVNCSPELDFWEIARVIKADFKYHTENQRIFPRIVQIGVIMNQLSRQLTPEKAVESWIQVNYDLSITNLGRLDFPLEYGPLKLEAIYGPSVSGIPKEIVLGVTTLRDQLRFTLIFTNQKLEVSQAHQIKTNAMTQLEEAVGW